MKTSRFIKKIIKVDEIQIKKLIYNNQKITTKGFDNFMLWIELDTELYIDSISQYTDQ
ncbi:hypothetical protein [uncultured Polaribacter sp.]|uniref:hypothetical protein n=1 Tax=uncultured Polaribacter sp. TaxID=174711 RepID=UPI00262B8084|nr:hypothetical protein [uncultured Polaribacter sp.]